MNNQVLEVNMKKFLQSLVMKSALVFLLERKHLCANEPYFNDIHIFERFGYITEL